MKVVSIVPASVFSVCVVGLFILSTPAFADDRVWFWQSNVISELSFTNGGRDWALVERIDLPPHIPGSSEAILAGGGRYIVWTARLPGSFLNDDRVIVWFDTRARTASYLPSQTLHGPVSFAVDRRSGRLVALDQSALYLVDLANPASVATIPFLAESNEQRSLAVARGRAFVGRQVFDMSRRIPPETAVFDLNARAVIGVILGAWQGQVSTDERQIIFLDTPQYDPIIGYSTNVDAWDVDTVTLSMGTRLPIDASPRWFMLDNMLVAAYPGGRAGVTHLRGHNPRFFFVPTFDVDFSGWFGNLGLTLRHASSRSPVLALSASQSTLFGCESAVSVMDPMTATTVRVLDLQSFGLSCGATMLALASPTAPSGIRAKVTDRNVTLDWEPPPDVGDYEISAGVAAGRRDVVFRTRGVTSVTVNDVPPGQYFVRVRALNEVGAADSTEIRVVVP